MMPSSIRFYHVSLPLVSSMAFLRFINLVAHLVRLFLLLTLTNTIWHLILCAYFNQSPRMNSRSRTLLGLRTGPRRITITMKWCARLTLVHCLRTFHLMRHYKFFLSNWCPSRSTNIAGKMQLSRPLGIRAFSFFIVLFFVFMDRDKVNMANIQPSWPHAWSITHTYKSRS